MSPHVLKEVPKLPVFSGTDNDATFVRWHHEVKCLMGDYNEYDVITSVRKSVKSPAADELIYSWEKATIGNILYTKYSCCMGQ